MILGNILIGLGAVVHSVFQLAWGVLLARIVLSWLQPNPGPGFVRSVINAVYALTEPALAKARNLLPFLRVGALDLSPIALFLALGFLDNVITRSLFDLGHRLV